MAPSAITSTTHIKQGVDRLSLLPDEILIYILSRLPICNAITTGILSKRWRNLWTHISCIEIIYPNFPTLVLPKLFNVHKLTFYNYRYPSFYSESKHFTLINHIFQLSSLIVLELHYGRVLSHTFADKLTVSSLVNLKVLNLRFGFNDDGYLPLLERIIMNSPLLEELYLSVRRKSQSSLPKWYTRDDDWIRAKHVIIDAPNLKNLRLNCYPLSMFFFPNNSVTAVQSVRLRGGFGALDQSFMLNLDNIFEVSSKARSLTLESPSTMERKANTTMLASQAHLESLPNLVHLKCAVCCSTKDITDLIVLLSKCPILEVLTLNFREPVSRSKNKHSELFQCDVSPSSLEKLKRVVIHLRLPLLCKGAAFFVAKYLLGSATILERLNISFTAGKYGLTTATQCDELLICRDILALPRKSVLCQVKFYGVSLKSSYLYSS